MQATQNYQQQQKRQQSEPSSVIDAIDYIQQSAQDYQNSSVDKTSLRGPNLLRKKSQSQQKSKDKENEQIDLDDSQQQVQIGLKVSVVSQNIVYTNKMVQLRKKQRTELRKWFTRHPNQLPFNKSFCKKQMPLQKTNMFAKQANNVERRRRMTKKNRPTITIKRLQKKKTNQSPLEHISRENSSQESSQQQLTVQKNIRSKKEIPKLENNSNQQKLDFDQFLERRMPDSYGRIDLGVANLSQVVEHAHSHELLTNQIYFQFVSKYEEKVLYQFIDWFKKNTLQEWNFNRYKINLIDHRRISTLLVSLYPNEFVLYEPLSLNERISQFLEYLYQMNQIQYFNLMDQFDNAHRIKWWKPIQIKYFRIIRSLNPKINEKQQEIGTQNMFKKFDKSNFVSKKIENSKSSQSIVKKVRQHLQQKNKIFKRSLKEMLGYDQLETKSQYKGQPLAIMQTGRIKKQRK